MGLQRRSAVVGLLHCAANGLISMVCVEIVMSCGFFWGFFFVVLEPSERPCRLYYVRTFGEPVEVMWVEDRSTHTFHGAFEMEQPPLLRKKGKQREQSYRCTVITPLCSSCLHALIQFCLNN